MRDESEPFEVEFRAVPQDIDELKHVNNIVYLRWVQESAIAHWQAEAPEEAQRETVWVVLRHEIDYKSPAFLNDVVVAHTWVGTAKGLIFERHTVIKRASDQQLLAQARTLWCPISTKTHRPMRLNQKLRAQFSQQQLTQRRD